MGWWVPAIAIRGHFLSGRDAIEAEAGIQWVRMNRFRKVDQAATDDRRRRNISDQRL